MQTVTEKTNDAISEGLYAMYDKAIDHAIDIVKTGTISTTDINLILEITNFKNHIISRLLNLTKSSD